ncbi:hypothetical protein MYCTH_86350 [Thermothelomyces thermophilus ATCC 42464]|uniref:Uncharacterized protein n=1 Tax=Thermothelomyces thermophilus (strain ATCC 42464 / BCRC 31852 / DSM 1799) TaxID=573729 RepID=G2Q041_THET4|nr:uncharacterized protein MYCTH_86350 [Thermothelomyces thermophilus ATCC 42464]AEO54865.1 hypothetical protein MYCTH_86350 [Thermothelomyces thermophilus ATCC 42464]
MGHQKYGLGGPNRIPPKTEIRHPVRSCYVPGIGIPELRMTNTTAGVSGRGTPSCNRVGPSSLFSLVWFFLRH